MDQAIWYSVRITYFTRYAYQPETPVRAAYCTTLLGSDQRHIQEWADTTWGEMLKRHDQAQQARSAQSFYAQVPSLAPGVQGQAIWI